MSEEQIAGRSRNIGVGFYRNKQLYFVATAMSFEFNKELNGWFLTTDDGFKAYYDFHGQKFVFCGKIVDSESRKYSTNNNTEYVKPETVSNTAERDD